MCILVQRGKTPRGSRNPPPSSRNGTQCVRDGKGCSRSVSVSFVHRLHAPVSTLTPTSSTPSYPYDTSTTTSLPGLRSPGTHVSVNHGCTTTRDRHLGPPGHLLVVHLGSGSLDNRTRTEFTLTEDPRPITRLQTFLFSPSEKRCLLKPVWGPYLLRVILDLLDFRYRTTPSLNQRET